MKQLWDRDLLRWGLPGAVALIVFVLYTSVASIVLVSAGGPTAMASAVEGDDSNDYSADDFEEDVNIAPTDPLETALTDPRLPDSCDALFSSSVVTAANAAGLLLNPAWADGADPGGLALQDPELASVLASVPALDCRWLGPDGGSGVGIRSVIAAVDADEAAWLNARFAGLGYRPQNELGGTRYFFEANAGGTPYGESHIVREGIWFATHWVSYGPKGYTADMVANYFAIPAE